MVLKCYDADRSRDQAADKADQDRAENDDGYRDIGKFTGEKFNGYQGVVLAGKDRDEYHYDQEKQEF
jgi:hypothetical protein